MIEQLINFGGHSVQEVDDLGRTPIHLAAISGSTKAVYLLLELGASVNIRDRNGNRPEDTAYSHNQTTLSAFLTRYRRIEQARMLTERNLEVVGRRLGLS